MPNATAPVRFVLVTLADDEHVLLLVAHHAVWDGGSNAVFESGPGCWPWTRRRRSITPASAPR